MIVVTDTGPLYYLFLIGNLPILPALHGRVVVPRSIIFQELNDAATPPALRSFFAAPPEWLLVTEPTQPEHPLLAGLGLGERHAISLLLETHGDLLLSDDAPARKRAVQLGLAVTGTLGLIEEAACRGLLDFDGALERLTRKTNFRHTAPLIDQVRERHFHRMRKRASGGR